MTFKIKHGPLFLGALSLLLGVENATLAKGKGGRLDYDLPVTAAHKGGFDVSFAILHVGNPATGQGSLTVFGSEVKPGDHGAAKGDTDVCTTRLNAFGWKVHGFRVDLNKVQALPKPGSTARIEGSDAFALQGPGWALQYAAFQDHKHKVEVRLPTGDDKQVDVELKIEEPGKLGSLHGKFKAIVCPPAR